MIWIPGPASAIKDHLRTLKIKSLRCTGAWTRDIKNDNKN